MATETFSLYIVQCADGTLYTGIATDVARRLEEHRAGPKGAKYLRGRGPLRLLLATEVGDRATASRLEYRVKQLPRTRKLALANGELEVADLLAAQVVDAGAS